MTDHSKVEASLPDEISALEDLVRALKLQQKIDTYIDQRRVNILDDPSFYVEWEMARALPGYGEVSQAVTRYMKRDLSKVFDQIKADHVVIVRKARSMLAVVQLREKA